MSKTSNSISILFYLKKRVDYKKGSLPIYLRVTVLPSRFEVATNRKIEPSSWNTQSGRAKGTREEIRALNAYLDTLQSRIYEIQHDLIREKLEVTIENIKSRLAGVEEKSITLIEVIKQHNEKIAQLIGKGYTKATWTKYETTLNHVKEFLKEKYQVTDIPIKELKFHFIAEFEHYLLVKKNIRTNTNGKYIKNLKKILNECVANELLEKNPFAHFKVKHVDPEIPHLTQAELNILEEKQFDNPRLSLIKDMFLFSCYTGFSYIDALTLMTENLLTGDDGKKWLVKNRQKTDIPSRVPLLQNAEKILLKYADHPKLKNTGRLLPHLSNQKTNAYLKEIADVCAIRKEITFHVARHTFATTVTLNNGVPIETVSKMLGHKKILTTQIYARVLDGKIGADMDRLEEKLKKRNQPENRNQSSE